MKIITDLTMPSKDEQEKAKDLRTLSRKDMKVKNDPLADVFVTVNFYCPECKAHYGEYLKQAWLRRMPNKIPFKGRMVSTRQPDGTILKLCEGCVKTLKKIAMAQRSIKR